MNAKLQLTVLGGVETRCRGKAGPATPVAGPALPRHHVVVSSAGTWILGPLSRAVVMVSHLAPVDVQTP